MKRMLFVLLVAVLLTACGSAVTPAPTYTPYPTYTIVAPTETMIPTETPTETPTEVPTETPEPTATLEPTPDLRVIDIDPREIILSKLDLPEEAKYYLAYETPGRNSEILSIWGVEEGRAYLEASGRVDGWMAGYGVGTQTVSAPETIYINAVLYRDHHGPNETDALEARYGGTKQCGHQGGDYEHLQTLDLPSTANVCLSKVMQSSGKYAITYYVGIRYRNIAVQIWMEDDEGDFDLQWVIALAETQMDHILALPLSSTVTWQP